MPTQCKRVPSIKKRSGYARSSLFDSNEIVKLSIISIWYFFYNSTLKCDQAPEWVITSHMRGQGLHSGHAPGGQSEVHCCSSSNIKHPNCLIFDKGENTADSVSHTTASCRHIVYTATNTRDHFRHQKAGLLPYLILLVVISICSYACIGSNRNQCVYIHTDTTLS